MKSFDLEAAKRGDPIVDLCTDRVVHFIGLAQNKDVLIEIVETKSIQRRIYTQIGMAPKKRTIWVNFCSSTSKARYYPTQQDADYHGWLSISRIGGKAYPVEIEE